MTKRHIVTDSGSTSSAAGTWSAPTRDPGEQVDASPGGRCRRAAGRTVTTEHDEADARPPRWPTRRSRAREPRDPLTSTTRKPARGRTRTRVATWAISALHLRELVDDVEDRRRKTATTMPSPTVTSAAATTITKKTVAWPPMSPEGPREGDERQGHGVEHQLDAHEHDQRAAPGEEPEGADAEEHGGRAPGTRRRGRSRLHLVGAAARGAPSRPRPRPRSPAAPRSPRRRTGRS